MIIDNFCKLFFKKKICIYYIFNYMKIKEIMKLYIYLKYIPM